MMKLFGTDILEHEYDDIRDDFIIINNFLEKYCSFDFEYLNQATKKKYFDRLIKILRYFKANNIDIVGTSILDDTKWFYTVDNYINIIYAIYFPKDFIKEDEDDYLFSISNVIFKSSIGFLNRYGKNYEYYFKNLNEILKMYAFFYMVLRRDLENESLNKTEEHFFEIVLGTFLAYYYVDYEKIENEKILNAVNDMFHYREFLEKWSLNGIDERNMGSYEKEKFIAKSMISSINLKKIIIK